MKRKEEMKTIFCAKRKKWIGVDLDGTLAYYEKFEGADKIGEPIEKMTERVKKWLEEGKDVRILTARVSGDGKDVEVARKAIEKWCEEVFGKKLPITCEKDQMMEELWDDRAIQVEKNTGNRIDGKD